MKVLFIAPFPPPITGHSLAAIVFHDDLVRTHQVASIDLSVGSAHDGAVSIRRIAEVGRVIARVFRHRRGADVVYLTIAESVAGNLKDLLIYLACAGRLSRVYIHLHGGSIKKLLFDRHPFLRWLNRSAIRRLGGVIISGHAHDHIFADMIDQRRVHLVPNFAQDDLFVSPEAIMRKFGEARPLRVLYLSSMTEPKGYLDLLEAYLGLGGTERGLMRLDFAGKFATLAEHERFADMTAGVTGIRYHGVVDAEAKRRLFAEAHVFCLPTKMFEGQPLSILEAYASGCVVVATGQDGIRDVFTHGQNGTEVAQGSPSALAAALGELAERGRSLLPIALENRRLAEVRYRTGIFNTALRAIIEQAGRATGSVTSPRPPTDGAWGQKRRGIVARPTATAILVRQGIGRLNRADKRVRPFKGRSVMNGEGDYAICANCIMDVTDANITFDTRGWCDYCNNYYEKILPNWHTDERGAETLARMGDEIKRAGKGKEHDCLIGISGGADSSYVTYLAKAKLGLRPLLLHVDTGWNSQEAVNNVEKLVDGLGLDLHTEVVNWLEMKDLQLAFFKAQVPHLDTPQDHAIFAGLYNLAEKQGFKYIITGANYSTECVREPLEWHYHASDLRQLKDIHRRFGSRPLKTFPTADIFRYKLYYRYVKGVRVVKPLNHVPYVKEEAMKELSERFGWQRYSHKHFESRFTRFYEGYWLPKKFGYDKRRAHFSSLILTGQMTRAEALDRVSRPAYDEETIAHDFEYVATKLDLSVSELEGLMNGPNKSYRDYRNNMTMINAGTQVLRALGLQNAIIR